MSLAPDTTLPADYYQVYIPNQLEPGQHRHQDPRHLRQPARRRIPGQSDGQRSYQDLLNTGAIRNGMSRRRTAGGAFMTGFVVVPPATTS